MRQLAPTGDINGVRKVFKVLTESLRELDDPRAAPAQETRELLAELLAREQGGGGVTGHLAGGHPAWLMRAREPWAAYPVLAGAALMVGAILGMRGREPVEIILASGFGACFLALAWSDLRRRIIPNRIVYPVLVLALAASGAWPDRGFAEALAGGLGALAVVIAIRGLSGGGLGRGDVKMAALMGAVRLRVPELAALEREMALERRRLRSCGAGRICGRDPDPVLVPLPSPPALDEGRSFGPVSAPTGDGRYFAYGIADLCEPRAGRGEAERGAPGRIRTPDTQLSELALMLAGTRERASLAPRSLEAVVSIESPRRR